MPREVGDGLISNCNAQIEPLNVQYVEFVRYKLYMFANMFADAKSVRLDARSTIFMFILKMFANNVLANSPNAKFANNLSLGATSDCRGCMKLID